MEENQPEKKKKSKSSLVAVLLLVAAILCCLGYIGVLVFQHFTAQQSYGEIEDIAMITPQSNEQATKVDSGDTAVGKSPIDLPALQEINSDVYAWIRIPGTYVDYPVAQSKVDDNYYLHRSIYKKYLFAGMIYTQSCNALDFSDPVTVVYGHNMRSTTMFTSLHYFEDPEFFDTHDVFYIYTADRVLTYHIVSAYKYDNRHIMNAFDFSDPEVLADYQEYVLNPVSTLRNVRKGVTLDENSKLVVLSTCMSNDKSSRFLVNGVLVSDVPIEQ
ncbi:MAG: class B sortase [Clostridia bacterium]|nr:class B sortase [Clostridia bacterium]